MNKIIAVIAIVFAFTLGTVFSADIATAVKPVTEVLVTNTEPIPVTGTISSDPACPAENIQYWATLSFAPSGTITHPTLPSLPDNFHVLEVQVPTDQAYKTTQIVLDRLIEIGYLDATSQPLVITDVRTAGSVGTSTICAEN